MTEERRQCTATAKSTGERCNRRPIKGGTVCKVHGGGAPQVRAKAKREVERQKAEVEARRLAVHLERDEDPAEVLISELRSARALAAYWEDRIAGEDASVVTWVTTEDGATYPGGLSVEAQLWQRERDRAIAVAQSCLKLGLEERRVRLAERDGQEIAGMLGRVLRALGVFDDPRAPDIVRQELRRLEQRE